MARCRVSGARSDGNAGPNRPRRSSTHVPDADSVHESHEPPVRIIVPGKLYPPSHDLDLTHTPMFRG